MEAVHAEEKNADYVTCIAHLPDTARAAGTRWLDAIVDSVLAPWQSMTGRGG
jgi:hypothetical protein